MVYKLEYIKQEEYFMYFKKYKIYDNMSRICHVSEVFDF